MFGIHLKQISFCKILHYCTKHVSLNKWVCFPHVLFLDEWKAFGNRRRRLEPRMCTKQKADSIKYAQGVFFLWFF